MLLLLMHRLLTLNWRVLVRRKNARARHTILIYLLVSKKKLENMYTPTEHKLPLNESPTFRKAGRPNIVRDELVQKIKEVIVGVRLSGAVISRRMVISIRNGVLKANDPNTLSEFGGTITLTEDWARGILRSMDWVKRKATTGKVEASTQFLAAEKFTFQKAISTYVCDHDIPTDLIINLDQTPLSYVSPGKYTFNMKGAKHVPIKGVDDKRQITATFAVSASGDFLPMQLIYVGGTKKCLPKFTFPRSFHVTYTKNH